MTDTDFKSYNPNTLKQIIEELLNSKGLKTSNLRLEIVDKEILLATNIETILTRLPSKGNIEIKLEIIKDNSISMKDYKFRGSLRSRILMGSFVKSRLEDIFADLKDKIEVREMYEITNMSIEGGELKIGLKKEGSGNPTVEVKEEPKVEPLVEKIVLEATPSLDVNTSKMEIVKTPLLIKKTRVRKKAIKEKIKTKENAPATELKKETQEEAVEEVLAAIKTYGKSNRKKKR